MEDRSPCLDLTLTREVPWRRLFWHADPMWFWRCQRIFGSLREVWCPHHAFVGPRISRGFATGLHVPRAVQMIMGRFGIAVIIVL
eukprot:4220484-Lingulodinium_polyedra.AAC.1